jgi:type I restriction enzyme S subunit
MNADRLMAHFERISDAPDAVSKLRRFILDLAVRGKLVDQDPGDEPAEALLERIASKKGELSSRSRTKTTHENEKGPYELPPSWIWSRIADLGLLSPRNNASDSAVCSFVPMSLISAAFGVGAAHEKRPWGDIKKGYTHIADGDVAVAKITPCFENGKSTVFRSLTGGIGAGTTELHVVRPIEMSPDYIVLFLKSPCFIENGIPRMTGTAGQKRLPGDYFAYRPFPLPPLAEQHRIIAKVDELMMLCDRLEASQAERDSRRDRLVVASLNRLSQPTDSDEFKKDAGFTLSHLNRLSTKPEHIKELRKAILNLAVRGKLVPQDDAWQTAPLSAIAEQIVDCPHSTPKWQPRGKICVRTNQFSPGKLDLTLSRFVSETTFRERIQRLAPQANDILYSREGGILGVACRVPEGVELCLGQRMMLIRPGQKADSAYLELVLNSPLITEIAKKSTTGGAAPRVNVSTVKAYPIPLPPLAEQKRIVAKVDELMGICDKLETQLESQQKGRRQLLEALLHEALEGVG